MVKGIGAEVGKGSLEWLLVRWGGGELGRGGVGVQGRAGAGAQLGG